MTRARGRSAAVKPVTPASRPLGALPLPEIQRRFGTALAAGDGVNGAHCVHDFIWKWAPEGDATQRLLKLQAEYLTRNESGEMSYTYDTASTTTSAGYESSQRGWYAQAVYQFMPRWRLGLRHDRLGSDNHADNPMVLMVAGLTSDHAPRRNSALLDYSHSEFSRLRLQYSLDRSSPQSDRQLLLQYIVSLGAHGAHSF